MLAGFSIYAKGLRNQAKSNPKRHQILEQKQSDHKGCQHKPTFLQNRALEPSETKASLPYFFSGHSTLVGFTGARLTSMQKNLGGL